jgi:hypothetical protein
MSLLVLALVIAAAVAHAGWNLVAKPAAGGAAFVWLCAVAGTLLYLPAVAAAVILGPGPLGWAAIGLMLRGDERRPRRGLRRSHRRRDRQLHPLGQHAVGAGALSPIVYVFVLHEQDVERRLAAAAAILVGVVILTLG